MAKRSTKAKDASEVNKKLEQRDAEEIHEKAASSARIVYLAIHEEGEEELKRPTSALAWSGLAAGLSMGFSLVTEGLIRSHLPDASWRPLIAKLGYPIGFLIVVLGRQQLFTENTLTVIIPLLRQKTRKVFLNVMRLWIVVLIANLIGTAIFAYVIARTPAFDENIKGAFLDISRETARLPFWTVLLRGIFAGWLIALMVWLLPVAEVARIWVILIITYVVGLGSSCHIVAGSVDAIYGVAMGINSWGHCIGGYMIPSLLGNILGGCPLVAALNHAQVVSGGNTAPAPRK